jgi:hypothetical protein
MADSLKRFAGSVTTFLGPCWGSSHAAQHGLQLRADVRFLVGGYQNGARGARGCSMNCSSIRERVLGFWGIVVDCGRH